MLASDQLIVTHVTTHCSLSDAIARTKQPRIRTILKLTSDAVSRLIEKPRIAVAGLNPHAGENGLFGPRGDRRDSTGQSPGRRNKACP
jgi:4-hydroxythreonine-4-phosphate dehydrogenase